MWTAIKIITSALLVTKPTQCNTLKNTMFNDEQIIFRSTYNITKILVPPDANTIAIDDSDIPTIFFTVTDEKYDGGAAVYVLEGLSAYEILIGARDTTSDRKNDIYFGAKDGIYKYNRDALSAKKYDVFKEDIIQIQCTNSNKLNAIFILTKEWVIYKITRNGTLKTKIYAITCALEFVLDMSDNIYYIACDNKMPYVVNPKSGANVTSLMPSVMDEFSDFKLIRPASVMENSVPFIGDGCLYILHSNGTSDKKEFQLDVKPSAYSIDGTFYLVVALNGKIYEYNIMEIILKSMFGGSHTWPKDVTRIVMSMVETARDNLLGFKIFQ